MVRLYSIKTLFNVVWTLCLLCCPTVSSGKDTIPTGLEGIELGEVKYGEGDVAGALKIFMDIAHEADDRHDTALACLAYYNIGVTYFSLYSNVEAIQNFQKAYDLCLRNNLGSGRETEIIGGISGVFFQLGNYSKAKQMLSKALAVAQSNNDSVMISTFTADMALLCNKTGDFDSVPHWLDMSRRYLRPGKPTINLLEIAAETAMKQKNYTRAEQLCNEILSYPTDAGANRGLAYTYLLCIAGEKGHWTEALEYEKKAAAEVSLGLKIYYFQVAAKTHEDMGDYRGASALKDSVMTYKDSLETINNRQLLDNENIKFEVMKYQLEAERMLARQKSRTAVWISIATAFLFLLVILALLWRQQQQRHRTQQQMLALRLEKEHKEKELAEERIYETELVARHKHEILQKEIERQNTQLQANAMFVSSRNQLIEDLLKYIDNIKSEDDLPEIRNLRKHLGRMLGNDSKDREEFMMNVEAADPDLSRRLLAAHPDLLQSDIKFLGYIKMNMSMKEIAAILNVNPDSCKRRKIRISKKLGLASSADLYAYLLHLSDKEG
ncbi:MAG: hypothetical protein K2K26_10855 [Muribaculaceae bacterium]|nr:hypothetical protein [Muribaculaceae bacterium]